MRSWSPRNCPHISPYQLKTGLQLHHPTEISFYSVIFWDIVTVVSSGDNYQEILYDEHYDYCREDTITPPPLPPRKHLSKSALICQTFPRRRKNLFHHLGVETDPALTKNHQEIFVIQKSCQTASSKLHRKDLERFLGVPSQDNKKDLSSFLGVNRSELERVLKAGRAADTALSEGSGGSLDTDSSSLWSTQ